MDANPEIKPKIENWRQFTAIVRASGQPQLARLDDFQNAILVAGCQRSGTTMLSRILTKSKGMVNYYFGADDELDAALILSGAVEHTPAGRYCFQTTYLDEHYREYIQHKGQFKLIWVIRNPYSVVTSFMYNWNRKSLVGTFDTFASHKLGGLDKILYRLLGNKAIDPAKQASLIYATKNAQLFELHPGLGLENIFVVDYDDLVLHKESVLPQIYRFVGLEYFPEYAGQINEKSVGKKNRLSEKETRIVRTIADPVYQKMLPLKSTSLL